VEEEKPPKKVHLHDSRFPSYKAIPSIFTPLREHDQALNENILIHLGLEKQPYCIGLSLWVFDSKILLVMQCPEGHFISLTPLQREDNFVIFMFPPTRVDCTMFMHCRACGVDILPVEKKKELRIPRVFFWHISEHKMVDLDCYLQEIYLYHPGRYLHRYADDDEPSPQPLLPPPPPLPRLPPPPVHVPNMLDAPIPEELLYSQGK